MIILVLPLQEINLPQQLLFMILQLSHDAELAASPVETVPVKSSLRDWRWQQVKDLVLSRSLRQFITRSLATARRCEWLRPVQYFCSRCLAQARCQQQSMWLLLRFQMNVSALVTDRLIRVSCFV